MGRPNDHRAAPTPDPAALAAGLERVRAGLHRWLDRIEQQLDEAPPAPIPDEEREHALRNLDEQREALRAEAQRLERDWEARLDALEHDRRLLAEAWERLEREQLALPAPSRAAAAPTPADQAPAPPRPARPAIDDENPVDRAILRQFEALRQDVRRKAEIQRGR